MEITFTKEQFEALQQARENLSHQVPDGDLAKVITKLSQQKVAGGRQNLSQQKKITQVRAATMAAVAVESEEQKIDDSKPPKTINKTLTPKTRQAILKRDQVCQYRSPITGKICGGKIYLQVDHVQPRWAGGNHDPQNLQVLCGQHNRMKYKKEAGLKSRL